MPFLLWLAHLPTLSIHSQRYGGRMQSWGSGQFLSFCAWAASFFVFVFQFHPFTWKFPSFAFLCRWIKFHCVFVPCFCSPFISCWTVYHHSRNFRFWTLDIWIMDTQLECVLRHVKQEDGPENLLQWYSLGYKASGSPTLLFTASCVVNLQFRCLRST